MKFVMADSRVFTDFQPNCQLNYNLQEKYSLMDTHDYRYFLQQNSEKVKKDLMVDASGVEACKSCPVCQASLAYNPKNGHLLGGSPFEIFDDAPCALPNVCPPPINATNSRPFQSIRPNTSRIVSAAPNTSGSPIGPSGLTYIYLTNKK